MWNWVIPIGMQLASGLSLLSVDIRAFFNAAAHGVSGRPPGTLVPISQNAATGGDFGSAGNAGTCGSTDDVAAGVAVALAEQAGELGGKRLAVRAQPVAREVGLAVGRARRRGVHAHAPLRVARGITILEPGPLGRERHRTGQQQDDRSRGRHLHLHLAIGKMNAPILPRTVRAPVAEMRPRGDRWGMGPAWYHPAALTREASAGGEKDMVRPRFLAPVSLALAAVAATLLWAQDSPPPLLPPQAPSGPTPVPAVLRNYTPVTEARLRTPRDGDWLMNRRTYDGWGYSPLNQITTANVARLKPVWSFSTGVINGHEAAPTVHDGVMFIATPGSQVIAIEASTGTLLWRYRRPLAPTVINRHPTTRGVALLGDKVFLAASDAVLMALDARTGARCGRPPWPTTGAVTT